MKARRLLEGSNFGPETLQVIFTAFDDAWAEIAEYFDGDEAHIQSARVRLAHAVLALAHEDSSDPSELRKDALQVFQLGYRRPFPARK